MRLLKWWRMHTLFACVALIVTAAVVPQVARAVPAIAQYDQPKYPPGFTHFDYADPQAPDTGTLNFENYDEAQSYDSLNPFLTRGSPAPDIKNLMFDTLMQRSWDELASEYALIADDVEVAVDGLSATFHINPAARFSNGDAITAADVKYSFDTLTSPQASPLYNAQFSIIKRAVVVDSHTIRFEFKHAERDAALIAGDLPVFSPKWGQRADGTRPAFDQIANEPPIASGAYLIEQRRNDKQIAYVRNPHYWAANLPSRRGMFRFARVSFKLYLDQYTALEAFKAGDVDARMEYSSTQWARKYVGKNFSNGMLKKGEFPDGPAQMQGFLMNLRKPMFQDVRVRHALALAFDFDWMSRMMFYGQYRRTNSFWDASPFAASGMPSAKELALLEPYRSTLPPEVFGPMVKQPSTLPPGSLRANLRQARDLLAQAGWHYRDGALRDANGTPMTIEIIDDQPGMDRLILPYTQALATLGIHAYLHEIDSALYQKRLDNFEYDMTTYIYSPVTIPGAELTRRFGSAAASQPGSENYPGVKSKAVDALIRAALAANTLDDLETATHALDRVLINLYVLVPQYYMPNARIAYKTTLGHPAVVPASYQYEDWIVDYWYGKRPAVQPAPAA
ncbi:extracellular solute-binding protein [Burkholderia cenocepacia]|uniref:ABC transporter substrate-binding protein n=1 Tax=Burkholderia cenocepacia TaxID=95486 RepID=A0AAD0NFE2_9BURK|nr:extracellular solute-binding protein [Burkholderia cenocepacia]EAY61895.1 ABC-type oligopeptide transport system, periplasmic component [Burkholderia cenocepacia PC184]AWG33265.1 ABC transporter substrate-binding protein [Burkholderia cenocepacia]MCA7966230.1 extracellular solute-binding protein [Burkholderia cenocepacia]MDR8058181.1 extracellular solute-binding protein [Burkholderia cenocepacia]MDR8061729.1 extracellular solute-binding protein [Burkholderia cenocepacia]